MLSHRVTWSDQMSSGSLGEQLVTPRVRPFQILPPSSTDNFKPRVTQVASVSGSQNKQQQQNGCEKEICKEGGMQVEGWG